jgi:hypothetical protein
MQVVLVMMLARISNLWRSKIWVLKYTPDTVMIVAEKYNGGDMLTLTTSGNQFLLHGKPFRILSGSMHYFRVLPEYWCDRLGKMRAFGLNTVETYVAWNLHEPQPGDFHFEGQLDLLKFIEIAARVRRV